MQDMNTVFASIIPANWTLSTRTPLTTTATSLGTDRQRHVPRFLLTPALPGDANLDGMVDINDLTIVLSHYGQTGQAWANGNFTCDGTVNINDLTIVLAHYGDTVASSAAGNPSAAPEPAGVVLLLCGGLAALAAALRRRKNGLCR